MKDKINQIFLDVIVIYVQVMMPSSLECRDILIIWIIIDQGPTVFAVSVGGNCSDILFFSPVKSLFFLPLSERGLDRDGSTVSRAVNTKQPTTI